MPTVVETPRLVLRHLEERDASFIVELLNDPDWIRFIGDRGIRTPGDAVAYLRNGPIDMYARVGFGLNCVESKESGEPVGICGLIKRDNLEDVDLGFAFLPRARGRGHALDASKAMLAHARDVLGLRRVVAIVAPGNDRSTSLLERLGFRFESLRRLPPGETELMLYAVTLPAA